MFNRSLSSFVPSFYKDIVEMNDLMNAEEQVMDVARSEMSIAFANTFVLTADIAGVEMFESMLRIVADPQTQDLEFRRQRILNRLSMSPPFTFRFLKQKLDEIVGAGAWDAYIDFDNYTLYVESSAADQNWYSEVEFTINRIKPCNIVFINVPRTALFISLNEEISYEQLTWRYRLGSWKLGANPFATLDGGGIIKMSEIKSIQPTLLNDAATFVAQDVATVRLNDKINISNFKVKQASENIASIEYSVTPDMTSLITNIKLLKADGTVLTQSSVYVPVTQAIVGKHTITVKEGV